MDAANDRREGQLKSTLAKTKLHLQKVAESGFKKQLREETKKEALINKTAVRQQTAKKNHFQYLLAVKHHQKPGCELVRLRDAPKPVAMEVFWEINRRGREKEECIENSEPKPTLTKEDIAAKLARAAVLKTLYLTERTANTRLMKAKARANWKEMEVARIMNSMKLDRKLRNAQLAHESFVLQTKKKAQAHIKKVIERANKKKIEREVALEAQKEEIQAKIRQAAANRGNALI